MWRKHLIGICFASFIFLGFTILYLLYSPLTSDKKLTENFYDHQANFERLIKMANEDTNIMTVSRSGVSLKDYSYWRDDSQNGFSIKRWNEYKEVFNQLGNPSLHRISKKGDIIEINFASIKSSRFDQDDYIVVSKGYAYSLKEPSPLVESLDEMEFKSKSGTFYKKIGENWYLYFHSEISKAE